MFNKRKGNRPSAEVNSGSMADIAFLLLIFFLVTTTIASDKGLPVLLPPKKELEQDVKIKERNIFNILVNSNDLLLVEEQLMDITELKDAAKTFITNNGQDPESSESPEKAVISFKTDRGTSYEMYVKVRDQLKTAYAELRADHLKVSVEKYQDIKKNRKEPENKERYDDAKKAFPEMISDAEPSSVGGN